MSKTGNLKHKDQVSLIISAVVYMSMNNLYAIAETAPAANSMRTTQVPVQATASASSVPLIIGIVALIIVGVVVFMMTKKQDNKRPGNSGSNKISPPLPGAKSTVSPPKTPVALPSKINVQPKTDSVVAPQPSAPIIPPVQPKPSVVSPKVETPVVPAMTMPNITPPAQPATSTNSDAKPLFDSGKLDSDLDNIFTDPKSAAKVEEVQKAPLFDSSQLDDDLDALFVEVNKKPEKPKEEKKGLFDSSQLDSDLDNLFAEDSSSKNTSSSDNLAGLFDSPPAPKEPVFQAPTAAPTFDLDDLNFLSNDTKKEDSQANNSSSLDLSSLNFDTSSSEPVKTQSNSTFDLDDLNFLANDTKKDEPKTNALPTLNLSDIVNSTNSSALDSAPLSAGKVDLNNTTMGLNISDYLNSMQKPEEKKSDSSFSLSNTIPPHSLNLKDLNLDNVSVSKNSMTETTDKKDAGVISIGKMLVDQNALEEIIKKAEKGGKAGLTTTQVITAVKGRSLDTLLVDINNVPGILGSIIVGKDGLVIANTMPDNIDKDLVGALTSSLFTNIDTQIKKMKKGNLKRLTVETGSGVYILTEIEMGTLVVFGQEGQKVNLSDIYKSITAVTGKK